MFHALRALEEVVLRSSHLMSESYHTWDIGGLLLFLSVMNRQVLILGFHLDECVLRKGTRIVGKPETCIMSGNKEGA